MLEGYRLKGGELVQLLLFHLGRSTQIGSRADFKAVVLEIMTSDSSQGGMSQPPTCASWPRWVWRFMAVVGITGGPWLRRMAENIVF
jgi:hypothetical protein